MNEVLIRQIAGSVETDLDDFSALRTLEKVSSKVFDFPGGIAGFILNS